MRASSAQFPGSAFLLKERIKSCETCSSVFEEQLSSNVPDIYPTTHDRAANGNKSLCKFTYPTRKGLLKRNEILNARPLPLKRERQTLR